MTSIAVLFKIFIDVVIVKFVSKLKKHNFFFNVIFDCISVTIFLNVMVDLS